MFPPSTTAAILGVFFTVISGIINVAASPIANSDTTETTTAAVDFFNPLTNGGSFLDASAGLGEPLNVIISGKSTPGVLTQGGFLGYAAAVGFAPECFGQHIGTPQTANLGDGRGAVPELEVIRQSFNIPVFGTCLESLEGGNHFRVFPQNGTAANSGALFLAVSKEEDVTQGHTIVPDGYNIGRDELVNMAVGEHKFFPYKYTTTVTNLTNLLAPGAQGINHGIAQDGVIKLLTVTRTLSL